MILMKKSLLIFSAALVVLFAGISCGQKQNQSTVTMVSDNSSGSGATAIATFGGGCFWCTEAIFQNVEGVSKVVSGYMGGKVKNPTYREVSSGLTGHAEVIQISYDTSVISYPELLEIFWKTHDPTTLNQQGADVGTQYRSVVFYHDEEQRRLAEKYKEELDKAGAFDRPIVTEISPASAFYVAEDYHQNYYNLNGKAPYCTFVIAPKLEKFRQAFGDKLKK